MCTSVDVAGLLHRLHTGKAPGVDGVTSEHLLFGSTPTLLCALARLLTGCLSSSAVPSSFTESAVVPLLKNSQLDPNCLDNYRPISITTCASKLLELLILDELHSSFSSHDLQFGFILKRGTTEASLLVGETIQRNRRMGLAVFAANLDARKCFDRIWHDGLFYRLMRHLSVNCWLLVVYWYRHLTARVSFSGTNLEKVPGCARDQAGCHSLAGLRKCISAPTVEYFGRQRLRCLPAATSCACSVLCR